MLVDSHCHLDHDMFDDLPHYINRAHEAGVSKMLTISTSLGNFQKVMRAASASQDIFASVGVHPLHVHEEPLASTGEIVALTAGAKVVAIGETGLDYHYNSETKELQKLSFIHHIKAAQTTGLPLIVHTRDAAFDTLQILRTAMKAKQFTGVIHCFTQDLDFAMQSLEMGLYISFSGIVTFSNAQVIQQVAKTIPLQRMLVETDAPYLAPIPHRGKNNEPAFVTHVAKFIADLREVPYNHVCEVTTHNFNQLFNKTVA
jgi:TatD DNase family protein